MAYFKQAPPPVLLDKKNMNSTYSTERPSNTGHSEISMHTTEITENNIEQGQQYKRNFAFAPIIHPSLKIEPEPKLQIIGFILTSALLINALYWTYESFLPFYNEAMKLYGADIYDYLAFMYIYIEFLKYPLIAFNLLKILMIKNYAAGEPDPNRFKPFRWAHAISVIYFFIKFFLSVSMEPKSRVIFILWYFLHLIHAKYYLDIYAPEDYKTSYLGFMKPWIIKN